MRSVVKLSQSRTPGKGQGRFSAANAGERLSVAPDDAGALGQNREATPGACTSSKTASTKAPRLDDPTTASTGFETQQARKLPRAVRP